MARLNPEAPEFIPSQLQLHHPHQHQHQHQHHSIVSWSGFPTTPIPPPYVLFSSHRLLFLPFPPKLLVPRFLPFPSTPSFNNESGGTTNNINMIMTKLITTTQLQGAIPTTAAPYLEDIEPSIIAEAHKKNHQQVVVEETKEGAAAGWNVKGNYRGVMIRRKKGKVGVQYHDHHKCLRLKNKRFFDKQHYSRAFSNKNPYSSETPIRVDGYETTVMIKNIPNKYSRDMLIEYLEKQCMLENEGSSGDDSALLAFDFVYLPIDFQSGMNKGYAFVNFTSPEGAWKFNTTASHAKWDLFQSHKIREVVAARLQGIEALERHFETMNFPWESEEVLPLFFDPPRDGIIKGAQRTVGRLLFKPRQVSAPVVEVSE